MPTAPVWTEVSEYPSSSHYVLLFLLLPVEEGQLVLVAEVGIGAGHQELVLHDVLGTASGGGRNLVGLVEVRVIHLVDVLLLEQDRFEPVAPEHLGGQVGAARLRRHGGRLHHPLQDHHDLKVGRLEVLLADPKQRTLLVNLVENGDWRNQENPIQSLVKAHVDVDLIQGDVFPLVGDPRFDELRPDVCLYYVALAQVPHPPHQTQLAVPHGDDGVVAEQQGLRSLLGPRHLGHDGADHEAVDDAAHDGLEDHHEDRRGALLRHAAVPVADGGLGLDGEQKGGHEAVDLQHAGGEVVVPGGVIQVPVQQCYDPEGQAEGQPGEHKHQGEDHQHPPPADVHARGEDVRHVPLGLVLHVGKLHIALAVLLDEAVAALAARVDLAVAKAVHAVHGGEAEAVLLG